MTNIYHEVSWDSENKSIAIYVHTDTQENLYGEDSDMGTAIIFFAGEKNGKRKWLLTRNNYKMDETGENKYKAFEKLSKTLLQDLIDHMEKHDILDSFIEQITIKSN